MSAGPHSKSDARSVFSSRAALATPARRSLNIVQDLFTEVLDWTIADLNNQVGYADVLLSRLSVKHLLIETKRPGALVWSRRAIDAALAQARGYADKQKDRCIAVSDGAMLYVADVVNGGCHRRCPLTVLSATDRARRPQRSRPRLCSRRRTLSAPPCAALRAPRPCSASRHPS